MSMSIKDYETMVRKYINNKEIRYFSETDFDRYLPNISDVTERILKDLITNLKARGYKCEPMLSDKNSCDILVYAIVEAIKRINNKKLFFQGNTGLCFTTKTVRDSKHPDVILLIGNVNSNNNTFSVYGDMTIFLSEKGFFLTNVAYLNGYQKEMNKIKQAILDEILKK